ncbi:MAG TPA: nuclear transport factor 2 family protein [Terriglobales bacterium]|nr:nuclear transport factor 2 family protein [Terriglobales bacterium]
MRKVLLLAVLTLNGLAWAEKTPEPEVRAVIEQFERGLAERDLAKIEPLMAEDLVAFENGHRNDGWADFRDHHLVPEMKEPAPPMKSELVRLAGTPQMGWGYTRTTMTLTRKSGEKVEATLWSVYVLEKRGGGWKIVALDWSFWAPRPSSSK